MSESAHTNPAAVVEMTRLHAVLWELAQLDRYMRDHSPPADGSAMGPEPVRERRISLLRELEQLARGLSSSISERHDTALPQLREFVGANRIVGVPSLDDDQLLGPELQTQMLSALDDDSSTPVDPAQELLDAAAAEAERLRLELEQAAAAAAAAGSGGGGGGGEVVSQIVGAITQEGMSAGGAPGSGGHPIVVLGCMVGAALGEPAIGCAVGVVLDKMLAEDPDLN